MTEALEASFASWEKERVRLNITKGECRLFPPPSSSSSSSSSLNTAYTRIPTSWKTFFRLSFFLSFFLTSLLFSSSLCTFHGVQVSQRLLITGSLPRYSWSYSRALTFSSDLCILVCSIAFSIPIWAIAWKCIWSIFFFFYLVSQRIFCFLLIETLIFYVAECPFFFFFSLRIVDRYWKIERFSVLDEIEVLESNLIKKVLETPWMYR